MSDHRYDIVLFGDFRFPGGTSSAVAEEIKAGAAAGYRIGLVHLEAPILTYPFPLNRRIRALIDGGLATMVQDQRVIEARLAIAHNPHVLKHMPQRAPLIQADTRLLVVQHPPTSADGQAYYNIESVRAHADDTLGGEVTWAPVGPLVRTQFAALAARPPLLDHDWYNVVDVDAWALPRERFCDPRPVIGRHSRADRRKWPDTAAQILAAYPDDPRFLVRILGGAPFLNQLDRPCPRNWEILPFGKMAPEAFLATIDFFVYFHHSSWVEAFGCTIAEAMASGALVILPAHFRVLFGEAAVYATPEEVVGQVLRFRASHEVYRRQAECGRGIVAERFSHQAYLRRLEALIGPPASTAVAVPAKLPASVAAGPCRPTRRVLFIPSNGVGMGHVTRLLAVARRCPEPLMPVFATMSQALPVIRDSGYLAEHLPYHRYLGCDIYRWNKHLHQEINELIAFYDVAVVFCDFNAPYQGIIDAAADNPQTWFVWCRRGMWQPGVGAKFIEREHHFNAVLEPQDLAGAFDGGLTRHSRSRTRTVPPIRLLDHHELLPRELARRELGLDLDRPAVIVLLGAGNNYDYSALRQFTLDHLAARGDVQLAVAEWLMADSSPPLPEGVVRIRRFPLARWFRAFDAAISAVGYNSYHELIFAGIPTVFVPNENPQQDDQVARARYAERHGLGFCVRTSDTYRLKPTLDRLLDPDEQAAIRARCAALDSTNGAAGAARMIEELAWIYRADRVRPLPSSV